MPSRLGLRLAAALVPAVALLLPAAAHAEKVVTDDVVGDAQAFSVEQEELLVPAPDEVSADITRTVVAHGNRRLSITVHFRDLSIARAQFTYVRVITARGKFDIEVQKLAGSRAETGFSGKRGTPECRALRAKVDGGADQVTVSLPTACLDSPRWVQLGVGAVSFDEPTTEEELDSMPIFADDGHRDTIGENSIGKGPRIHRG